MCQMRFLFNHWHQHSFSFDWNSFKKNYKNWVLCSLRFDEKMKFFSIIGTTLVLIYFFVWLWSFLSVRFWKIRHNLLIWLNAIPNIWKFVLQNESECYFRKFLCRTNLEFKVFVSHDTRIKIYFIINALLSGVKTFI